MKKLLCLLFSLFILVSLVGCGANNNDTPSQPKNDFDAAYWQGDWYGWWTTSDGKGAYEDLTTNKICFDCYASVDVYEDGTGTLYLWDTETSKGFPLVKAEFQLDGKKMNITSGFFFYSGEWLKKYSVVKKDLGSVTIDPNNSMVSKFDHMIDFTGNYEDAGNGFTYHFFLKPWGASWDDVKNGDTSDCIFKDMMPLYYDDWYFSLQNLKQNLPDSFAAGVKIINDYIASMANQGSNSNLGDKASATGQVTLDKLKEVLPFLKANGGRSYKTTYDEVAQRFGCHGKLTDSFSGYNIYRWWSDDNNHIDVTFSVADDGNEYWNVTAYNGVE